MLNMTSSAPAPHLRREQVAGMNIHYIMWSFDYFLDVQQRLGFKTIELWAARAARDVKTTPGTSRPTSSVAR